MFNRHEKNPFYDKSHGFPLVLLKIFYLCIVEIIIYDSYNKSDTATINPNGRYVEIFNKRIRM